MEVYMSCIFICYDIKQKNFFEKNDEHNLIYGAHPKTHKLFWVYERNEHFNELLKEWANKAHSF